jgi:hypothetical protein
MQYYLMHNNSNMIVHILRDIAQEARRDDTDTTKCNAHVVDILVSLRVRELTCVYYQLVRPWSALDARKLVKQRQQRSSGNLDCLLDNKRRSDVKLGYHDTTDEVSCRRNEFG